MTTSLSNIHDSQMETNKPRHSENYFDLVNVNIYMSTYLIEAQSFF